MNKIIGYIVLVLVLASCGTKKTEIAEQGGGVSAKDYPYIEAFHEGVRLKAKGRIEEAIAKLEECLVIRQDDDAVFYALSQLELMRGNMEQSSLHIMKAAEIDPDNTWYVQELAYMFYEQGDVYRKGGNEELAKASFKKSIANFKKLVDLEPRNVDWQYGYAGALQMVGENEKAIGALNKTEDQVGINPELSIQKFDLYLRMGKPEEGLKELDRARTVFPKDLQLLATMVDYYYQTNQEAKAVGMLEELVAEDPENGRAHLALADLYRQKGDNKRSYEELKLAFAGRGVEFETKAKILLSLQEASFKVDPDVFVLAELLVASNPNEAQAHSILGDFLLQNGDEESALAAYKKALEFEQGKYPIWNQVLLMEYQAGKFEDLYADSKECLTLYPSIATVYLLNGVAANQLKIYDEAVNSLSLGHEMVVDDKQMKAEFFGQLGEAYFGLKDNEEGKKAYRKAIELDPASSLLKSNFAYRLATAKTDLELAISLIQQAVRTAPNNPQFLDTYGWILFQQGKYQQALDAYTDSYEYGEEDALIADHLGDAHFKTGDTTKAVEWWKKALELGGKNTQLSKKIAEKKYYEPIY